MSRQFLVEPHVDAITMPENLKVGLMISEARKKCSGTACSFDYHGFAFGQSPFHVPPVLVEALRASAPKGHYSAAEGIPELRQAIAGFNKRYFGLDIDPARIVVGPGTKSLLHDIFYIMQGDVIIPSPSWIGYFPQVKLMDKHFHTYHLKPENGYKIQPEDLDEFVSEIHRDRHMLVLNNPHNPTGALYTEDELRAVTEVCRKHNVIIVADEIYALSTYEIESFTSLAAVDPHGAFVTNGLSKDRSSGGYRLGYCILPEACLETIAGAFQKVAATVFTNVSTPTQYAAVAAYEPSGEIDEYILVTREIHRLMGRFLSLEFDAIEGLRATMPEGSFYFFVDFNGIKDSLRKKGVMSSNELSTSLLSHPYHFAAVTGDACLLDQDDYGARIAFVDYDGREAFEDFRRNTPKDRQEEEAFARRHAPRMFSGIETLKTYVADITG